LADAGRSNGAPPEVLAGGGTEYRQLLFINDYPPCTAGGAPVITRQLFRHYDPERMDVVCCGSWYDELPPKVRETFLPCRHTSIRSFRTNLRPRRIFSPLDATLNCLRLDHIMRVGRRIARERGVEAIFSTSFGSEMPHAAFFLSRELGVPFYYFESDRLDAYFTCRRAEKLIKKHRLDFLRSAKKLWLTSPAMIESYRRDYGVDGEFLFHFVDAADYQNAVRDAPPLPDDRLELVYTGSINSLFYDTMKWFCDWLNRGLVIEGRQVEMTIYTGSPRPELLGPHVRSPGLVKLEEIPAKLAAAHVAAVLVSFTQEPGIKAQVETSLYTKTIDYLASGRPVLVVSPSYSAEVDCFKDVACIVNQLDQGQVAEALKRLIVDREYTEDLRRKGFAMVERHHSMRALHENFLSHFKKPSPSAGGARASS